METALDVLSRAATMVQDNAYGPRSATKELPTARWRRERRMRANEYLLQSGVNAPEPEIHDASNDTISHQADVLAEEVPPSLSLPLSPNPIATNAPQAVTILPVVELNDRPTYCVCPEDPKPCNFFPHGSFPYIPQHAHQQTRHQQHIMAPHQQSMDTPLDMTVQTTITRRYSPPPPYREPLSGSAFASVLIRPSVITQAPSKSTGSSGLNLPKSGETVDQKLIQNCENVTQDKGSLCENVIDEHFRRSLGADYASLFSKRSTDQLLQPAHFLHSTGVSSTSLSVLPPVTALQLDLLKTANDKQDSLQSGSNLVLLKPVPPSIKSSIHPLASTKLLSSAALAAADYTIDENKITHSPSGPPQALSLQHASSLLFSAPPSSPYFATLNIDNSKLVRRSIEDQSNEMEKSITCLHRPEPSPTSAEIRDELISRKISQQPLPTFTGEITSTVLFESTYAKSSTTHKPPVSANSFTNDLITESDVVASVDDHFAKALGDTWKKLQKRE